MFARRNHTAGTWCLKAPNPKLGVRYDSVTFDPRRSSELTGSGSGHAFRCHFDSVVGYDCRGCACLTLRVGRRLFQRSMPPVGTPLIVRMRAMPRRGATRRRRIATARRSGFPRKVERQDGWRDCRANLQNDALRRSRQTQPPAGRRYSGVRAGLERFSRWSQRPPDRLLLLE